MKPFSNFASQKSNIFQSLGGGLFLIGVVWLGLVARDYALNVLAADATAASSESFFQTATLVSAALAAVFVGTGGLLYWRSWKGRSQHHIEHRHRVRTSLSARPMPLVKPVAPAPVAEDETVSLISPEGVLSNGESGGGRERRRVRVRTRLPKEHKKK